MSMPLSHWRPEQGFTDIHYMGFEANYSWKINAQIFTSTVNENCPI